MTSDVLAAVPRRHRRRRAARRRAVPVRQPRRMPDREVGPHQPRPRRRAGAVGDGRLRRRLPERLAVARRAGRRAAPARCWRCCTALLCSLPRVNDVATGIALMLLGTGLAFYLGKPLIQPQAPQLPPLALGDWSDSPVVQAALQVNPLLPLGIAAGGRAVLGLRAHALGPAGAPGRRLGERDQGARLFGQRHPHRRHRRRRRHRRPRRRVADAVLSGQLERRHLQRPGPDRGGAGDLRALEPAALRRRGAAVRRRRRDRARRCSRSASAGATTCSTRCPTC